LETEGDLDNSKDDATSSLENIETHDEDNKGVKRNEFRIKTVNGKFMSDKKTIRAKLAPLNVAPKQVKILEDFQDEEDIKAAKNPGYAKATFVKMMTMLDDREDIPSIQDPKKRLFKLKEKFEVYRHATKQYNTAYTKHEGDQA